MSLLHAVTFINIEYTVYNFVKQIMLTKYIMQRKYDVGITTALLWMDKIETYLGNMVLIF